MENTIQFIQVTPEQLESRIIEGVKKVFLTSVNKPEEDKLLSRNEAAKFLGVSTVTLWDWTNKGKIKSYGLGNKIFYKRSELLESLTPLNK